MEFASTVAKVKGTFAEMPKMFKRRSAYHMRNREGFQFNVERDVARLCCTGNPLDDFIDFSGNCWPQVQEMLLSKSYEPALLRTLVKEAIAHPDFAL